MKNNCLIKACRYALPGLLGIAATIQAQTFAPIQITTNSYTQEIVVPSDWTYRLNDQSVTATLDDGPQLQTDNTTGFPAYYSIESGDALMELGLDRTGTTASNTYGMPHYLSVLTNTTVHSHLYEFYGAWTNTSSNVCLLGSYLSGTMYNSLPLTETNPAGSNIYVGQTYTSASLAMANTNFFTALSFLCNAGSGPVIMSFSIQYSDGSVQNGTMGAPDWFNNTVTNTTVTPTATYAYTCSARFNPSEAGNSFDSTGTTSGTRLWSVDIGLNNSNAAPTNVAFSYTSGGRGVIYAISGSTNSSDYVLANTTPLTGPFSPIPISGFNAGLVVPNHVLYPITATMDGGTNLNFGGTNTWFEVGYDVMAPTNGFPARGSTITSFAYPSRTYQMATNYYAPMSVLIDVNHQSNNITPQNPATYSAISLLICGANIGTGTSVMSNYVIFQHSDGVVDSNLFFGYDWTSTTAPISPAWVANERVNLSLGRAPESLNTKAPRIYEALIGTVDSSPITNIVVGYVKGVVNAATYVLAMSGTTATLPPGLGTNTIAQDAYAGGAATFTATGTAITPEVAQWYYVNPGMTVTNPLSLGVTGNGSTITGATTTTNSLFYSITISGITANDAGYYICVVSNAAAVTNTPLIPLCLLTTTNALINGSGSVASTPAGYTAPTTAVSAAEDGTLSPYLNYGPSGVGSPWEGAVGPAPVAIEIKPALIPYTVITAARIYASTNPIVADPADFTLYGSPDGTNWSLVDYTPTLAIPAATNAGISAAINISNQVLQEVDFANTNYYLYYEVFMTNTIGGFLDDTYGLEFGEVQLFGYISGPPILTQPNPTLEIVPPGHNGLFTVGANGPAPFTYQWYTTPGLSPVLGATSATLATTNAGSYYCVVSNAFGSATSIPVTLNVVAFPTGSFAQQVQSLVPSGYWPLTESSGTVAYDYSGNGINGAYKGSPTLNAASPGLAGLTTSSANFGTSEENANYVDIPVSNGLVNLNYTNAVTMMMWFKPISPGLAFTTPFGHSDASYRLDYDTTGYPHFADGSSAGDNDDTWNHDIYDGSWHFIVGIFAPAGFYSNTSPATAYLYVDGTLKANNSHGAVAGSTLDVWIGGDPQYTTSRTSGGLICQCAIFSNALTALQVSNLYVAAEGVTPTISMPGTFPVDYAQNGTLAATVSGGPPFSYVWSYIDNNSVSNYLSGGVSTNDGGSISINITNAQTNINGFTYQLYVNNAYGSANASSVVDVILLPLVLSVTPATATLYSGFGQQYSVTDGGYLPIYYQWYVNGILQPGATGTAFTTPGTLAAGTYPVTVVLSNTFGLTTSSPVTLKLLAVTNSYPIAALADKPIAFWPLNEGNPPASDNFPNDGLVANDYAGGFDGFYTNADIGLPGFDPLDPNTAAGFGVDGVSSSASASYVGGINGIDFSALPGANANFSIEAWVSGYEGQVSGAPIICSGYGGGGEQFALDCGGANSGFRFYYYDGSFAIHSASVSLSPNNKVWYHVVGVLDETHSMQYLYVDGLAVATNQLTPGLGVRGVTLPISIGCKEPSQNTAYSSQFNGFIQNVAIYNYALSPAQVDLHFQGGQVPPIVTVPSTFAIDENGSGTLTASTNGTGPLSLQWFYVADNVTNELAGQTSAQLTLTDVQTSMAGYQYGLTVSNLYGMATSSLATLTINIGAPVLVSDLTPFYQTLASCAPFVFSVTASGQEPFAYTWYQDGIVIAGATNSTYSGTATLGANEYYVAVSNSYNGASGFVSRQVTVVGNAGTPPATFPPTDSSGWSLNGTSTSGVLANGLLTLTFDDGTEARSAWYNAPQNVENFMCTFTYQDTTPSTAGADGITFTIQNAPSSLTALGSDGGGFGYTGITPSVAFAINIYHGAGASGGLDADTMMFGVDGLTPGNVPPMEPTAPVVPDGGDPINVTLTYNGSTLSAVLSDAVAGTSSVIISTNINIPAVVGGSTAYIGLTGGDGGAAAEQQISAFSFANLEAPVMTASTVAGNIVLNWPLTTSTLFNLQSAPSLLGPWQNVSSGITVSNCTVQYTTPTAGASAFYRLQLTVQ